MFVNIGNEFFQNEVYMVASEDNIRCASTQCLFGFSHGVVPGHDDNAVREIGLELVNHPPIKIHNRRSTFKNDHVRTPAKDVRIPLLVVL